MKKVDELQELRGIGAVLAARLRAAGLDTFRKIAEGGEGALRGVRGINERLVPGILRQAVALSLEGESGRKDAGGDSAAIEAVRDGLQDAARGARERFAGKISRKTGRRLGMELVRMTDALDRIAEGTHPKRARKGVAKAQARLETLEQGGLKKFRKGLKKIRKTLTESAR